MRLMDVRDKHMLVLGLVQFDIQAFELPGFSTGGPLEPKAVAE